MRKNMTEKRALGMVDLTFAVTAGDPDLVPGSGRSHGGG